MCCDDSSKGRGIKVWIDMKNGISSRTEMIVNKKSKYIPV
jgi:hypothetical protein